MIQIDLGEERDDGSSISGDGCDAHCGVEDPKTPEECKDYDITSTQFTIDAGVKTQEYLIKRLTRELGKIDKRKSTRRYIDRVRSQANEYQIEGWTITWSIPSIGLVCASEELFCVEANINASAMDIYLDRTAKLHKITRKVTKRYRRTPGALRKVFKRILKKEQRVFDNNVTLARAIPGVNDQSDVCLFPDAL